MIEVSNFQQALLDALFRGYTVLSDGQVLYSHLFFAGMRIIYQCLAVSDSAANLRSALGQETGWNPTWNQKVRNIEYLSVLDRFELALVAARMIRTWPLTFVDACKRAHLTASDVIGKIDAVPYWLYSVIDEHLSEGTYSPTLPEIRNAIEYLRRREVKVTKRAVSQALGLGDVLRKRGLGWLVENAQTN